eukprot:322561-Chlamydomonas_euryale.AAC.3
MDGRLTCLSSFASGMKSFETRSARSTRSPTRLNVPRSARMSTSGGSSGHLPCGHEWQSQQTMPGTCPQCQSRVAWGWWKCHE